MQWKLPLGRKRSYAGKEAPGIRAELTDSGYLGEVSYRFFSAQVVFMMVLAAFIAVSITTNDALLTGDNVVYFLEDLKSTLTEERTYEETLVYTEDAKNQFCVYRNGLAVLGENKLTLFSATGRENFSVRQTIRTPRLCASERFLAAYDLGGKTCLLCNSFHVLREITADAPIRSVAVGDSGSVLLITEGTETASEITLYNDSQSRVNRYRLQEYTVCGAVSASGARIALLSVINDGGNLNTRLLLAVSGEAEIERELTIENVYPLDCRFTEDGNLLLLTTGGVYLYTDKGDFVTRTDIAANDVDVWHRTRDGYVLLVGNTGENNSGKSVICIDNAGNVCYTVAADAEIVDVVWQKKTVVTVTAKRLTVLSAETGVVRYESPLTNETRTLLVCEDGTVFSCTDATATVYSIETDS